MARRFTLEIGLLALLLGSTAVSPAADRRAVISGVIRDTRGVPQMGALVQILSANAVVRATAFTDLQGHYRVDSLLPGQYAVRATAALFLPALRENLRLLPDRRAVVNLTLTTLFDQSLWLPASPRKSDEPADDWNWTLRSTAGRPILKFDEEGEEDAKLASAPTIPEAHSASQAKHLTAALRSPSTSFGNGEARVEMEAEQTSPRGSTHTLHLSMGQPVPGAASEVPLDLSASLEQPLAATGSVVSSLSYQSHPEISLSQGGPGLRVVSLSSAERIELGDFAEVEAGSRIATISGPISATVTRPFLRVSAHPSPAWTLTYALATSPELQDFDSANIDGVANRPFLGPGAEIEKGQHQALTLSAGHSAALFAIAVYMDSLDRIALQGSFSDDAAALPSPALPLARSALLVDHSNGSFEALSPGYRRSGINLLLAQALGRDALITVRYCTGSALEASPAQLSAAQTMLPPLHVVRSEAASASVKLKLPRTGTRLRASYRWQPGQLVTSIDPYQAYATGNYLSLHLRQRLVLARLVPGGMEFTLDGANVLGQGYQHFDGGGIPLYLASSPTSLQAGLAFSF